MRYLPYRKETKLIKAIDTFFDKKETKMILIILKMIILVSYEVLKTLLIITIESIKVIVLTLALLAFVKF